MKKINEENIMKVVIFVVFVLFLVFSLKNSPIIKESGLSDIEDILATTPQVVEENIHDKNFSEMQKQGEVSRADTIAQNDEDKNMHILITPQDYKRKLESGEYTHLDIRTPEEYNHEKIAEGLNIDFYTSDFKDKLNKLDKSKKYIYHCRSGNRSSTAISVFKELGFIEIYELEGGINNWKLFYQTII